MVPAARRMGATVLGINLIFFGACNLAAASEDCNAGDAPQIQASSLLQARFERGTALGAESFGFAVSEGVRASMPLGTTQSIMTKVMTGGGRKRMGVVPLEEQTSWYAGPFGPCSNACNPPVKIRDVVCKSFFGGSVKDDAACAVHPKPPTIAGCFCHLETCAPHSVASCDLPGPQPAGFPSRLFEEVGCYQFALGDDAATWLDMGGDTLTKDFTCMEDSGAVPCRSGLPFFRSKHVQSAPDCYHFCVKRGLDIFGVVKVEGHGHECRCGASALNLDAWAQNDGQPKPRLAITGLQPAPDGESCPVLVLRYNGYHDSGGLPEHLLASNLQDKAYVDSIVQGTLIGIQEKEDNAEMAVASLPQVGRAMELQRSPRLNLFQHKEHRSGKGRAGKGRSGRGGRSRGTSAPAWIQLSGGCTEAFEGVWEARGQDANGAQYYKLTTGTRYLYYDPDCDGMGNWTALWVIDDSQPDPDLPEDVDNDAMCTCYAALKEGINTTVPIGSRTWAQLCNGSWQNRTISLAPAPEPEPTPAPIPPTLLQLSGGCRGGLEGVWEAQGQDSNGAQYYKLTTGSRYLYYDPDCDGMGNYSAMWIIDTSQPDPDLSEDMDDDDECIVDATLSEGIDANVPMGAGTWWQWCNDSWELRAITLATAQPTPAPIAPARLQLSGGCLDGLEGIWEAQGPSANGAQFYQLTTGAIFMYFDTDCSGQGNFTAMWIIDNSQPDPDLAEDLDNDAGCSYYATLMEVTDLNVPTGSWTWSQWCNESWQSQTITLDPAPEPSPTPTPAPGPAAPAVVESLDVYTGLYQFEMNWIIEGPQGQVMCHGGPYSEDPALELAQAHLDVECPLPAGMYSLHCVDLFADGWNGGYVEIAGNKYGENWTEGDYAVYNFTLEGTSPGPS